MIWTQKNTLRFAAIRLEWKTALNFWGKVILCSIAYAYVASEEQGLLCTNTCTVSKFTCYVFYFWNKIFIFLVTQNSFGFVKLFSFLLSSPGFSNASPSMSPGFSRVRVFFGSKSESCPGFEICLYIPFSHRDFSKPDASFRFFLCSGKVESAGNSTRLQMTRRDRVKLAKKIYSN